ncbi:putative sensor protein [Salinarchaeum sp. Harcht-Bsk1]|uniref:DICT sensory domain-containing protein n=1 Tax=Salinarchaeum sp. Harcht-Bsk1 TaxID=1333523 RepID=UPI000342310A|nr:DICT sensory domain-containing protein [Salinarchaeum sp. Harcht-Bsk1]AGN02923.1 putative sensor protein [Salinarchaeum sp. Harcht-Bsk1]
MSLDDVIASVERSERTLTVFNPREEVRDGDTEAGGSGATTRADSGFVDELSELLVDRNVTVQSTTTTSGRPVNFSVLEMDGVVLATFDVDELHERLAEPSSSVTGLGVGTDDSADVLRHLQEATFTSFDRERMLQATREIEDRAFRIGEGDLRAGFQTVDRLLIEQERYVELGKRGLDVTVYATPDRDVDGLSPVTVRATDSAEIATHWFVAFDGGGEPSQECALLAEERSDGFYGFWTYDPDVVDWILTHLVDAYH